MAKKIRKAKTKPMKRLIQTPKQKNQVAQVKMMDLILIEENLNHKQPQEKEVRMKKYLMEFSLRLNLISTMEKELKMTISLVKWTELNGFIHI